MSNAGELFAARMAPASRLGSEEVPLAPFVSLSLAERSLKTIFRTLYS